MTGCCWMCHIPFMHHCRPLSHLLVSLRLKCLDLPRTHMWNDSSSLKSVMVMTVHSAVLISSLPRSLHPPPAWEFLEGKNPCHACSVKARVADFNHPILNTWRNDWMSFQILKPYIANRLPLWKRWKLIYISFETILQAILKDCFYPLL